MNVTKNTGQTETRPFQTKMVQKKIQDAKKQSKKYSKEMVDEFGDRVKLQKFTVISIGFDRLLYMKD
jgi:hypothetical protein